MEETVKVSVAEYEKLLDDQLLLLALQGAGVDNWEGWDYAIESYEELKKD